MEPVFNRYSRFLKKKYGKTTYRVSVAAGFSCPVRAGGRGDTGCAFCDAEGSRAPYLGDLEHLEEQILQSIAFLSKRYKAELFLLYFQAFSNTYAPIDRLKEIYDRGLSVHDFKQLIVSTRPDCIDRERADLLASYIRPDFEVWTELGLQSANPDTLSRINRGHGVDDFLEAFHLLRSQGIKLAVHVIFGLPGEGLEDVLKTIRFLSALKPEALKIHDLHLPKASPLFTEFLKGELSLPSTERHLEYVARSLERIPPEMLIMRLSCDTPVERLGYPKRSIEKTWFYRTLEKKMRSEDSYQGKYYTH